MTIIKNYYQDYTSLGLIIHPVEWDTVKNEPKYHPRWSDNPKPLSSKHNGIMIQTSGEYGCLDFDIKNTDNKEIFNLWKAIVLAERPEIYDKLFIEQTRNKGYHAWMKYPLLNSKKALAESEVGAEVIALYAKGPLVYTFPTPGYTEVSGSMLDLSELTTDEFEYITMVAQGFNEYKPAYDPNKKAVAYPNGLEKLLSHFDTTIPDDTFEILLSQVGLSKIPNYKYRDKDFFTAYRRNGSSSQAISAKVYYRSKRVVIFSASMNQFPNWHNRDQYPVWSLPASFLLFYKNNRDWDTTVEEIKSIIESSEMDMIEEPVKEYTGFPMHVFPDEIAESIFEVSKARSLAPQFVATAGLWTVSSLAGTRYTSDFNGEGKNILFCLLVAPVSVGKTPAFKVMCETPLSKVQEIMDVRYAMDIEKWEEDKAAAAANKKAYTKKRPSRYIPIAKDGTTEGYIMKSMGQRNGIGVYQDEAETILNAGSFKSNNDAISFFTGAFSGGRMAQIRADETKERVVPNLNINLLMGTQPSRVQNIFTADRLSSGFASRFLMVESDYMELNVDSDPFGDKKEICQQWTTMVSDMYFEGMEFNAGNGKEISIIMGDGAKNVYRAYYKQILQEANGRILSRAEKFVIGTEAKMSAYFPRLVQVLSIIHNHKQPEITESIVHAGWKLYRYYADSTIRIISALHGELETGLPHDLELLYQALPEEFTRKEAAEVCVRLNLNPRRFDVSVRRKDFARLVTKIAQGKYRKV